MKVGDTVRLNSGGPEMTVTRATDANVECIWACGLYVGRADFPPVCLTPVGKAPRLSDIGPDQVQV